MPAHRTANGLSHHPLYGTWDKMRRRCNDPGDPRYYRYGGRGITVDPRWDSFERFLADVGDKPSPRHSLDRVDNDGPYSPENCRWATKAEQGVNTSVFKGNVDQIPVWYRARVQHALLDLGATAEVITELVGDIHGE